MSFSDSRMDGSEGRGMEGEYRPYGVNGVELCRQQVLKTKVLDLILFSTTNRLLTSLPFTSAHNCSEPNILAEEIKTFISSMTPSHQVFLLLIPSTYSSYTI